VGIFSLSSHSVITIIMLWMWWTASRGRAEPGGGRSAPSGGRLAPWRPRDGGSPVDGRPSRRYRWRQWAESSTTRRSGRALS